MTFDFSTLEPQIHQILSAPGTDLATISAKRVRRQLLEVDPALTADFLKENKEGVDFVISKVFEKVSKGINVGSSEEMEGPETVTQEGEESKKRKQDYDSRNGGEEEDEEDEDGTPSLKRAKKARKKELSDAELARKLSNEINGRSRRATNKGRSSSNGTPKKGGRTRKSAATVDSDESSDEDGGKKPSKRKSGRTGAAKGGFAKEYALR